MTIVTGASPQTYSGVIANTLGGGNKTLSLIVAGSGMETLNGTNTYTGATSVNGGTLAVNGGAGRHEPGHRRQLRHPGRFGNHRR